MKPKRLTTLLLLAVAAVASTGCNTLSPSEEVRYDVLMDEGVAPVREKNPSTAAALNLLPGVGDIYNGQWNAFVWDLLFYPYSIVWAVPQAGVTAGNTNKKYTLAYEEVGRDRYPATGYGR